MRTNKISFGSWYRLPSSQLKNLSAGESIRLGIKLAKIKSPKKTTQNYMGIYIDIPKKKENQFMQICDSYDILPHKPNFLKK